MMVKVKDVFKVFPWAKCVMIDPLYRGGYVLAQEKPELVDGKFKLSENGQSLFLNFYDIYIDDFEKQFGNIIIERRRND